MLKSNRHNALQTTKCNLLISLKKERKRKISYSEDEKGYFKMPVFFSEITYQLLFSIGKAWFSKLVFWNPVTIIDPRSRSCLTICVSAYTTPCYSNNQSGKIIIHKLCTNVFHILSRTMGVDIVSRLPQNSCEWMVFNDEPI